MPHAGFGLLREIAARLAHGAFVFTSNVDGQFQKAGFAASQVCECHGSIHHLQCSEGCREDIWPAAGFAPVIDVEQCRLVSPLPHCPHCAALRGPNVLMFGDWGWNQTRTDLQEAALRRWLAQVDKPVIIEMGAGTDVPSVRAFCEGPARAAHPHQPRAPQLGRSPGVGIACRGSGGAQRHPCGATNQRLFSAPAEAWLEQAHLASPAGFMMVLQNCRSHAACPCCN